MMAVSRGARSIYNSVAEKSVWRGMSIVVWPMLVIGAAAGLLLAVYMCIRSG